MTATLAAIPVGHAALPTHPATSDVTSRLQLLAPRDANWSWPNSSEEPFAESLINSLDQLAAKIRQSSLRTDPACAALAFWLRRAHVCKLREEFRSRVAGDRDVIVPAGHVLQIAPQNVDTLFLFSWAIGFLTGNASIVRVSTRPSEVVQQLLDCVAAQMDDDHPFAAANRFVTYEHDDEVTTLLSRWCDQRIVWGGDETVARLRCIPLAPHASERSFSTKFSGSVFSAGAVLSANDATIAQVAEKLLIDLMSFDQQACSSPQLIYWLGGHDDLPAARDRFISALDVAAENRHWQPTAAMSMRRLQFAFELACDHDCEVRLDPHAVLHADVCAEAVGDRETCGGGMLRHVAVSGIAELAATIQRGDQTLTYFGLSVDELRQLAIHAGRQGLDRIVPVGQALDFATVWDGYDLLADCTRRVTVR